MNINDLFSRIHDFDLDVPPDLDLNDIPMVSKMASTTNTKMKQFSFPWSNMNFARPPAADHFTLLQTTATQLYTDHAGTLQSLGTSIKPHLRGPLTPVLIILVSVVVSALASFIMSIIQLAILAAAVVYFFPSVLAAVPASATLLVSSGKTGTKPVSRTPVAAFASVLAASYAFSSIAMIVVLASSAYAFLNNAAVASAKGSNASRQDSRSTRRDEPTQSHSMFRRVSRHRGSS